MRIKANISILHNNVTNCTFLANELDEQVQTGTRENDSHIEWMGDLSSPIRSIAPHIEELQKLVDIQCSNGNWNYDPYMYGMANGMILMLSTLKGEEPIYLEDPKEWLCDKKIDNILGEAVQSENN